MGYRSFKKSFEHLLCTRYWIRVMKTHKRIRGPCPQSTWSPAVTQTWKQKCSKLLWMMWWSVYQGTVRPKGKKVKSLSHVWLFATPWAVAYHAPPSMGFSRQEYWSGVHCLLQRIFPTQGSDLGLPRYRQMLYHLSHQGSPTKKKE